MLFSLGTKIFLIEDKFQAFYERYRSRNKMKKVTDS